MSCAGGGTCGPRRRRRKSCHNWARSGRSTRRSPPKTQARGTPAARQRTRDSTESSTSTSPAFCLRRAPRRAPVSHPGPRGAQRPAHRLAAGDEVVSMRATLHYTESHYTERIKTKRGRTACRKMTPPPSATGTASRAVSRGQIAGVNRHDAREE